MTSAAETLARWATRLEPEPGDVALADRLAARLPEHAAWAVAAHVLDFDDLDMPSRPGRCGSSCPGPRRR